MLFAVLFDANDQLVAAAPACDQSPFGDRYWAEIYPARMSRHAGQHTGYIQVEETHLIERLLELPYDNSLLSHCAAEIESIVLAGNMEPRQAA